MSERPKLRDEQGDQHPGEKIQGYSHLEKVGEPVSPRTINKQVGMIAYGAGKPAARSEAYADDEWFRVHSDGNCRGEGYRQEDHRCGDVSR